MTKVIMPVPTQMNISVLNLPPVDDIRTPPPMKHHDSISSTDSEDMPPRIRPTPVIVCVEHVEDADHSDGGSTSSSSSGAKDSDASDFTPADEETASKIVSQVEFYFSDVNITKDAFLLKHVRRNREGYVSLKLISSFKRVKHVCKDWRIVADALRRKSTKLVVNDQGTKLRRIDPLPEYDQTAPSRTVVVIGLPHDRPSVEGVAEMLSHCGDIALVRVLRPGNPIPADVRPFAAKHADIGNVVCALVEFERTENAKKAVSEYSEINNDSIHVVELVRGPSSRRGSNTFNNNKNTNKSVNNKKNDLRCKSPDVGTEEDDVEDFSRNNRRQPKKSPKRTPAKKSPREHNDSSCLSSSETENERASPIPSHRQWLQPQNSSQRRRSTPVTPNTRETPKKSTCLSAPSTPTRQKSASYSEGAGSQQQHSPWVQRRLAAYDSMQSPLLTRTRSGSNGLNLPDNVLRLPKGPDGTRGFSCGHRDRLRANSALLIATQVCC